MPHPVRRAICAALSLLIVATAWVGPVLAAPRPERPEPPGTARPQTGPTVDALSVVKIRTRAFADARSRRTLGGEREGTGVVLDAQGLIVTIGYLILEAEAIELSTADGTTIPGTAVAYDAGTGLGLVRAVRPPPITPIRVGESAPVAIRDRVLIVGFDGVAPAVVVSRRPFVGFWEYMIEDAIYTAPPTVNWSGAALIDPEGKLLGIGSLAVEDAGGPESQIPGHMFVPIDLLKPVMKDLIVTGKSPGRPRPWIGVQTQEVQGNVIVTRVYPDSPAEATLRAGDVLVTLGGEVIKGQADFYSRLWSRGPAGVEVPFEVLREGKIRRVTVKSGNRDAYYRAKPTY